MAERPRFELDPEGGQLSNASHHLVSAFRELEECLSSPEQSKIQILSFHAKDFDDLLEKMKFTWLEAKINVYLNDLLESNSEAESTYEAKKRIVQLLNEELRTGSKAAIKHPDTGAACMLLAVGSPDGLGRYVLEDRETKKRSKTTNSLRSLLPMSLIPDSVRREGLIDRRKNPEGPPPPGVPERRKKKPEK